MNVTGNLQYSRETRGLRQSSAIRDSQFRLVFIYPILFDENLASIRTTTFAQDANNLQDLIRSFLAVTMLTEIFVSNALNITNLASKIGFSEQPAKTSAEELISALIKGGRGGGGGGGYANISNSQVNAYDLQQKIKEKVGFIRQLIKTDPKFSKLNPFINMITLQNLIDVPVIVGTQMYPPSSTALFNILVGSIVLRKPLTSFQNVQYIINQLKRNKQDLPTLIAKAGITTDPEEKDIQNPFWALLKRVKGVKTLERGTRKLLRIPPPGVSKSVPLGGRPAYPDYEAIKRKASEHQMKNPYSVKTSYYEDKLKDIEDSMSRDDIINFLSTDLDQVELFFKLVMDPEMLYRKLGLSREAGQMSSVVSRTKGKLINFISRVEDDYHDFLSEQGGVFIRSFHNLLFPNGSDLDFSTIKRKIFDDKLSEDISDFLGNKFMLSLQTTLEAQTPAGAKSMMGPLKDLCGTVSKSSDIASSFRNSILDNSINSIYFEKDELDKFFRESEKLTSKAISINKKFETLIQHALGPSDSSKVLLVSLKQNIIGDVVDNFIQEYRLGRYGVSQNPARIFYQLPDHIKGDATEATKFYDNFTLTVKNALIEYLYFGFLYILQVNLCSYIDIMDVEVDIASNDVLELPNYTLVIPVEVATAIRQIAIQRNWRDIVKNKTMAPAQSPSDSYTIGMVNYIGNQLGVPNIFVIDRNKKEVYYKMQHMSKAQKSSFNKLDTFVKLHLTRQQEYGDTRF